MRPVLLALPPVKADGLSFAVSGNGNNRHADRHLERQLDQRDGVSAPALNQCWGDMDERRQPGPVAAERAEHEGHDPQRPGPDDVQRQHRIPVPSARAQHRWLRWRVPERYRAVGLGRRAGDPLADRPDGDAPGQPCRPVVQVSLGWTDNTPNETGFAVQRSTDGVTFTPLATAPAHAGTGAMTFVDTSVTFGTTYTYRVAANTAAGQSGFSNTAQVVVPAVPAAPSSRHGRQRRQRQRQQPLASSSPGPTTATNETGFTVQRATNAGFTAGLTTTNVAANATALTRDRPQPEHELLLPDPGEQRADRLVRLGQRAPLRSAPTRNRSHWPRRHLRCRLGFPQPKPGPPAQPPVRSITGLRPRPIQ